MPKFAKLWRIRFQSYHFGWNNSAVNFCYFASKIEKEKPGCKGATFGSVNENTGSVSKLRSPRSGRLDGFYFCLSFRSILGPKKSRKIRHANTTSQFKIPATDAVCVKPKTGLRAGTTFDPKRVHFWVPSKRYLLCASPPAILKPPPTTLPDHTCDVQIPL